MDAEEREYKDYLKCVKREIPKIQIWKYTIGDKINILKSVTEIEHKRLYQRYRLGSEGLEVKEQKSSIE